MTRFRIKSDVNKKDYYLDYKRLLSNNITILRDYIKNLEEDIEEQWNVLSKNKHDIKKYLNIDLDKYQEYVHRKFNESYALFHIAYERVCKLTTDKTDKDNRVKLELAKKVTSYAKLLDNYNSSSNKLKRYEYANSKGKGDFISRLSRYYNKVVEHVMHGKAYQFSNNIGKFYIEYVTLGKGVVGNKIDFDATNKRKKELLDAGVELYSEAKAAWYKARNLKYEGVDYRVYSYTEGTFTYKFVGYNGSRKSYMFRPYNHRDNNVGTYDNYYNHFDKNFDKIMACPKLGIYNKVGILKKHFPHLLIKYQYE